MRYSLLFFLLLAGQIQLLSKDKKYQLVNSDNIPVAYANVVFSDQLCGTISNESGLFMLPTKMDGHVVISHLGFETREINLDTVATGIIVLSEADLELEEINVTLAYANAIVDKAINAIPLNYLNGEKKLQGFFRERLFLNNALLESSECDFFVTKKSYLNANSNCKIQISNVEHYSNDSVDNEIVNGLRSVIDQSDLVMHRSYILDKKVKKNHTFLLKGILEYDNHVVYEIRFFPRKRNSLNGFRKYSGELYIDTCNFAIFGANIHSFKPTRKMNNGQLIVRYSSTSDGLVLANVSETLRIGNRTGKMEMVITDYDIKAIPNTPLIQKNVSLANYVSSNSSSNLSIVRDSVLLYKNVKAKELYEPSFQFKYSSQFLTQLDLLSSNGNNIDYLVDYYLSTKLRIGAISSLAQTIYQLNISNPFLMVLSESAILRKNGLVHSISATNLNGSFTSYCLPESDGALKALAARNMHDFVRLHMVRNNLLSLKSIQTEDELFLHDYPIQSFLDIFYLNLFLTRSTLFMNQFLIGQELVKMDESKYYNDRLLKGIYYLSADNPLFLEEPGKAKLSEKGNRLMHRVKWFSFLNLTSPFVIGKTRLSIFTAVPFNFSLAYRLTPIGEAFVQNYWFEIADSPYKMGLTFYRADHVLGYQIDFTMFKTRIQQRLDLLTRISFWNQPQNFNYNADGLDFGFGIQQQLILDVHSNYSLSIGYKLKTEGYVPDNLSFEKEGTIMAGLKIRL